jgi:hypothetical protein
MSGQNCTLWPEINLNPIFSEPINRKVGLGEPLGVVDIVVMRHPVVNGLAKEICSWNQVSFFAPRIVQPLGDDIPEVRPLVQFAGTIRFAV